MPNYNKPNSGTIQPWGSHEVLPYAEAEAHLQVVVLGLPPRLPGETWQQWSHRKRAEQDLSEQQLGIPAGYDQQSSE